MAPIPIGAIAGLILSSTTSFLITGRLFHRYQKKTPSTWRTEWLRLKVPTWSDYFRSLETPKEEESLCVSL